MTHSGAAAPDPGRGNRISFFDEQARRRRGAWRLSAVCLLVASGLGIVLSAAITPLLLLVGGGLLHLAAGLGLAPAAMRGAAQAMGRWAAHNLAIFDKLIDSLDRIHGLRDAGILLPPLASLAPVAIPALIAAAVVWLALRGLAARSGGEDLIQRVKARPIAPDDREEHQLSNIVEEMAIAAGMPAPRLFVVDSPSINAAAVGRTHRDAAVLVTRGLLDNLDRSQTSAIVGHLMASIAGGDIRVIASILGVFQTFGFFLTFLDLPFRWSAWRALGGLALVAAAPSAAPEKVIRAGEMIEAGMGTDTIPDIDRMLLWIPFPRLRFVALVPLLPFMLLSILLKLVLFLWTAFFLGPPLALLWRNRRYMADAKAVELTRDPDALAGAISAVAGSGLPAGAEMREYLFVSAPPIAAKGSLADRRTMTAALHPPLARRLARLAAVGAQAPSRPAYGFGVLRSIWRANQFAALAIVGLMLLLVPLFGVLFVLMFYLTAFAMTLALAAGLMVVSGLLAP